MTLESTLAIVKPDAYASANAIVDVLKLRGFTVAERETLTLSASRAADLLRDEQQHPERPFFADRVASMTAGPLVVLVLRKQDAVADLRAALGPADPAVAKEEAPCSLRATFGSDITRNAVHGSHSPAAAAREIAFFFPSHHAAKTGIASGKEAKDYLNEKVAPILTKALQEMCLVAPADPVKWLGSYLLGTDTAPKSATNNMEGDAVVPATLSKPLCGAGVAPDRPKIYFVLGNAGSGKGSQCAKLVENFGFVHLSAGDLLRNEVVSKSPDGQMIEELIKDGKIVPGDVTIKLLKNAIEKNANKPGILVDGFPRALAQAGQFEKDVSDFEFCLFLDCPEEVLVDRLLKRGETSGRTDDNKQTIYKRFKTFHETCYPVVEYYEAKGKVRRIDANRDLEEVYEDISALFLR